MTLYFAFPLTPATQSGIDELLANLDAKVAAPQHELHTRLTVTLVDEVLANAFEKLIERFEGAGGESSGVLHTLINLLKSTVHVLVRQLLGKHGNDEVSRMAQFLRDRRVVVGEQVLFGFALPDALGATLQRLFAEVAAGNGKQVRGEMLPVMTQLADLAIARFYDDFAAPMELGFIKRKAVDIGRSTITKGVHAALNKLIPSLGQKELGVFAGYYGSLLVEAA